ncbi:ATP-binding protein [Actinoplanes sp. NPDC049265]|uniref:ATP-binding protein n=1 Tax=Actinoplanes sp. NPDC049265 TaxID=3363902 RepID=UPI003720F35B
MFGRSVAELRRQEGLTQGELATRTGISVRGIRDLEAGRVARPRASTVRLLADAFRLRGAERERFLRSAAPEAPSTGPRQLPLDIADFSGRAGELSRLDDVVGASGERPATVVLSAVAGMAGVGKTALALHWAHRVRDDYPDGQLYVNLRGFDAAESVADPSDVLRGFLQALDVPPGRIPRSLDERAALYRTVLGDRRVLVVLDNARDEEQVRPLLPAAGGCAVVVTSRDRMAGLVAAQGARPVLLDVLSEAEAWALLTARAGADRVTAEPDAAAEIIACTARLPLALTIAAARIATHPGFPLSTFAAELRAPDGRLDALADGDVRRVFSWSYLACSKEARRLFRLLGPHPGPDLTASAAAALAGVPVAEVAPLLAELTRLHLLAQHRPGRFAFHDLLRAYANELARSAEDPEDLTAARLRMYDHYLQRACAAGELLQPQWLKVPMPEPLTGTADRPATHEEATAWFTAEDRVLPGILRSAVETGADAYPWRLAAYLSCFYAPGARWSESGPLQRLGLTAATRSGDVLGQATARRLLARADSRTGRLAEADEGMRAARDLYAGLGDLLGEAQALHNLGEIALQSDRPADAIGHSRQAVALYRQAGYSAGLARALNAVGWIAANLGEYDETIANCREALEIQEAGGDLNGQAATTDSLAVAYEARGEVALAAEMYERSAALFHRSGDRFHEAEVLSHAGSAHHELGHADAAGRCWQEALEIYQEIGSHASEEVERNLARLRAGRSSS